MTCVHSLKKNRGSRGRALYSVMGKLSCLLGKGCSGMACWGKNAHTSVSSPSICYVRKPSEISSSFEWTLVKSCLSLSLGILRGIDVAYVSMERILPVAELQLFMVKLGRTTIYAWNKTQFKSHIYRPFSGWMNFNLKLECRFTFFLSAIN